MTTQPMEADTANTSEAVELPPPWDGRHVGPAAPVEGADEHMVRMRDGARLATDVYLPSGLRGRVPAVLVRLCYDKSGARPPIVDIAGFLTDRGYGVVVQDVRGRYRSEGERTPWMHEADDGFDTIDWIVRQGWCDERVAMVGHSYLGFTQWAAAATAHPGLRAIAPRVASERVPRAWFASDVASRDGVEWLARHWSAPGMLEGEILDFAARPLLDIIPAELENARQLHHEFLSFNEAELHAAIYPGELPAARLSIPALHTGAWFDSLMPYQMRDWGVVSSRSLSAGDQYLVMDAVDHMGTPFRFDDGTPATGDQAATLERHLERVAGFFDRYVLGSETLAPLPRVRYEIANGDWREAERWPPHDVRELRLYLEDAPQAARSEDGAALAAEPTRRGEVHWTHDPGAPVPSLVELDADALSPLPVDERVVHAREDVLTFTAPAAEQPLDIVGPLAVDVLVASTAPSMHLVAMLADVAPDGRAVLIAEGIAPIDTRYGTASATVQLGSAAYRVLPGHRLRLALASSRFPRYFVHPGTNDNLWTAVEARPAVQTLTTGGPNGSVLRLSTLPT